MEVYRLSVYIGQTRTLERVPILELISDQNQ